MNRHDVTGDVVERRGRQGVAVVCSCGWHGPGRFGAMATRRAQDDAREHLDTVREA